MQEILTGFLQTVPGLELAGGSTDSLMRLYAPFFVSSGCGSMPNTVISGKPMRMLKVMAFAPP